MRYESKCEFLPQARPPMGRKNRERADGAAGHAILVHNRQSGVRQVVGSGPEFDDRRAAHVVSFFKGCRRFSEFPQHRAGFPRRRQDAGHFVPEPARGVPSVDLDICLAGRNGARVHRVHRAGLKAREWPNLRASYFGLLRYVTPIERSPAR